MKKVLMISFRNLWPPHEGGYILRVLNIGKILKKKYRVDLLTLIEREEQKRDIAELQKIFDKVTYFVHPRSKEYLNTLFGIFSKNPLQVSYYHSKSIEKWLKENYKGYDLLYFNTIRTATYAQNIRAKKVIDLIDSISLNYELAKEWASFFWKLIYKIEITKVSNFELNIISKNPIFQKIFISSPFDKQYLENKINREVKELIVLPHGVREEILQRNLDIKPENNWISFFGKMDYRPNTDAVLWFSREVFPLIKRKKPALKFYIIGMNPPREVQGLERIQGIKVTGFLKDPYSILERSKLIVIPLRFGAGIQNKVLEAMALGKAIITSSVGARGIEEAKEGEHFDVVDTNRPKTWVEKILNSLSNHQRRKEIGREARILIQENYRWEEIQERLLEEIDKTIS